MERALQDDNWNVVGLAAVHAVISAIDGAAVHHFQQRSTAKEHEAAVRLIERLPRPDAKKRAQQAREVLALKHWVEYDDREFDRREAEAAAKKARRFVEWALGTMDLDLD